MTQPGATPDRADSSKRQLMLLAALAAYCLLACMLLFAYSIKLSMDQREAKGRVNAAAAAKERAQRLMRAAEHNYRSLATAQEAERPAYTGEEAIAMSIQVQSALQEFDESRAAEEQARKRMEDAIEQQQQLLTRWTPLIALLLLHLFGLMLLSNRASALKRA